MTPDNDLESWRQARRVADVPVGFADRVMAAVEQSQERIRLGPPRYGSTAPVFYTILDGQVNSASKQWSKNWI